MSLLNYSTTVPVHRTLSLVTELLVKGGARQMMTEYDQDGSPSGLTFSIATSLGTRGFTLPVKVEAVEAVMRKDRSLAPRFKTPEQARRVAWRIVKDWLEAQLALIATEMVTLDQVMLPYMRSIDGQTFYDAYLSGLGTQPALAAAAPEEME